MEATKLKHHFPRQVFVFDIKMLTSCTAVPGSDPWLRSQFLLLVNADHGSSRQQLVLGFLLLQKTQI